MNPRYFSTSSWGEVSGAPADPILGIALNFKACQAPNKVMLGIGAFRTDEGQPFVLEAVRKAEEIILSKDMDHEYSTIDGAASFREKCLELAFGKDCTPLKEGRIASCQSLSGTGSLRSGFEFMKQWYPYKDAKVYVPDPTWPTHVGIANRAGYEVEKYRYYSQDLKGLDFQGLMEDIDKAPKGSIIVVHTCAHNPTG